MRAIYSDNLSRPSITSESITEPGAAMKAKEQDLSDVQCHHCSIFDHSGKKQPNRRKQYTIRADNASNNPTDDSVRVAHSRRRM